jgi:large subunit ribosomal protein L24
MRKILKGDTVAVITGKDKGRTGKVLKVLEKSKKPKSGLFVIVENINVVKKHVKGNPQQQQPGGIIPKEAAIHISNVALMNGATGKPERVGIKTLEDGKKVRFFKSTGEVADV